MVTLPRWRFVVVSFDFDSDLNGCKDASDVDQPIEWSMKLAFMPGRRIIPQIWVMFVVLRGGGENLLEDL